MVATVGWPKTQVQQNFLTQLIFLTRTSAGLWVEQATIVHMIDGGVTWALQLSGTNQTLQDIVAIVPEPSTLLLAWNQLGPGTFGFETAANWTPSETPTAGVGHHRSCTRYGMEIVDIGLQVEVREEEVALDIELARPDPLLQGVRPRQEH